MSGEKQLFHGQCHCGAVRFSVSTDLGGMLDCNCSRCRRLGVVWQQASASDFTLLAGEGRLQPYRFNTNAIEHLFCESCGIESFARGESKSGEATVMVNVNCLDDAPPVDRNAITHWDGRSH